MTGSVADNTKYMTLTDNNFQSEVLESTQPVLVNFWADWSGPCHMMTPIIEELAADFAGRAKVGRLEVGHNPDVVAQYGIRSISTFLFFKDGQVVDGVIGMAPKQELADRLNALIQTT